MLVTSSEITIAAGFLLLAVVIIVPLRKWLVRKGKESNRPNEVAGLTVRPHLAKRPSDHCEPSPDGFPSIVDLDTIAPGSLSSLIAKRNWARRRDSHGESSF